MYIGWDIGIKNLAYCIVDNSNKIKELEIINLIDEPIIHKCICYNKNGNLCKSNATYINKKDDSLKYCNKHYNTFTTKEHKMIKKIKPPKKCSKYTLEELGTRMFETLDANPLILECENIIIENQPVLKNPTMKSIQIMLYSYFLIKKKNINTIKLVNASNKTKVYKGPKDDELTKISEIKDKYKRTKMTAIKHTQLMIDQPDILEYFNSHKKKDDLADAYLMTQYLMNINK
tara:strand:+ start:179 stop:874 length:696 start_codon:yes stop_codon:yes gene_type:complete